MPSHNIGDQPIEPAYREMMAELAQAIDRFFNGSLKGDQRKTGFMLLVFPFGESGKGRANYISNADKVDMVALLKEQIARLEGRIAAEGGSSAPN